MNKKVLLIIMPLLMMIMLGVNIAYIDAYDVSDNNGSANGGSATGTGQWQGVSGFRITIVNKNGNRVDKTQNLDVVNLKTWNGKTFDTSGKACSKIQYLTGNCTTKIYEIVQDSSIGNYLDKNTTFLSGWLKKDNYYNLKKYAKKTGYSCFSSINSTECENMDNHYIVVEPITVVGKYSNGYKIGTAYELTRSWGQLGWYGIMYENLGVALYTKNMYTFNNKEIDTGGKCTNPSDCFEKETANNVGVGVGIYEIDNILPKLIIKKKWTGNNKCFNDESESTYKIQRSSNSGKTWKTYKEVSIKGNGEKTVLLTNNSSYRYRVVESSVNSKCKVTTKNETTTIINKNKISKEGRTSSSFNVNKTTTGKAHITFTNTATSESDKKTINIYVYHLKNNKQFVTEEESDNQFSFARVYGVDYSTNENIELKKCKKENGQAPKYDSKGKTYSDVVSCYKFVFNNGGKQYDYGNTGYWPNNLESSFLERYNQKVTFYLKDSNNNILQEKTVDLSSSNKSNPVVSFSVDVDKSYRISEECNGCIGSNVYSKIFRNTTAFTQGPVSKGFSVSENDASSLDVYFINQLNQQSSCSDELNQIKNDIANLTTNQIKGKLLDLYKKNPSYNKLLNFSSDESVEEKIKDGSISCAAYQKNTNNINKNSSCEETKIGIVDSNNGNILTLEEQAQQTVLSHYISDNNYAQNIYNNLFYEGENEDADGYCFVNYMVDFSTRGIIKDNTKLINKSFLWEAYPSNQVGSLRAFLHCDGLTNFQTLKDEINYDYLISAFDKIKVKSNDKILQNLMVVNSDAISYAPNSNENLNEPDNDFCPNGTTYINGACYDSNNQPSCPDNYRLDTEDNFCYIPYDYEVNSDSCPIGTAYKEGACYDASNNPQCPTGYKFDSDELKCYYNLGSESSELNGYNSFNYEYVFPIVYQIEYYSNSLTGTATMERKNNYRLGWGVPVDINSNSGAINFKYNFGEDNDIYKLLNSTSGKLADNLSSTCRYIKEAKSGKSFESDFNVRFINTSNPFLDKYGNVRTSGLNWNSCYIAKNTIGTYSKVVAKDISNAVSLDKEYTSIVGDNRYCMYGDVNCDEQLDRTDVGIIKENLTNTTNENDKKLADVNKDGKVDTDDVSALEAYLIVSQYVSSRSTWGTEFINAQWNYYIKGQDLTTAKNSIGWNLIGNNVKCNPGNISNNVIVDNKNNSSSDTPMYSFTLSPSDIKSIRGYNKEIKTYNNSNDLICEEGENCVSSFITDLLTKSNNLTVSNTGGLCLVNNITPHTNIYKDEKGNDVEKTSYSRLFCSNKNS